MGMLYQAEPAGSLPPFLPALMVCSLAADKDVEWEASSRRRRYRRRKQVDSSTILRVTAVLALLSIDASQGLLLRSSIFRSYANHAAGASCPLLGAHVAGKKRRERRERWLPRCCSAVDSHDQPRLAATVHTLLIDNYDSYTYNLFQQLAVVNGRAPFVVYNDDEGGDLWKAIERMGRVPDNIVISPGPGRPDVTADFGMCAQALREAVNIPILGVCLGHEGLGIEHGAKVVRAPEPMHGRLSPMFHDGDALFHGVPQGARVVRYHSLVVDEATLRVGGPLKATAWTGDGALMAMRHKERPHWGVQFHPESVGTRHGTDIVRNFRDLTVDWGRSPGAGASQAEAPRITGQVHNSGMERNGASPSVRRGAGDGPAIAPELPVDSKAVDVVKPVENNTPACDGRRGPAARRRPLVLHVQEVEMAVGQEPVSMPDTEHAFRALYGDDPTAWWLDSSSRRPGLAADGQAKARFTFMGGTDGPLSEVIECYGGDRLVIQRGGESQKGGGRGNGERREVRANTLDYLKAEMSKMTRDNGATSHHGLEVRMVGNDERGATGESEAGGRGSRRDAAARDAPIVLPFDFVGGFVGFLGYELRHEANDVLKRSVGGTEWHWRRPGGGRWEDATLDEEVASDPDVAASAARVTPGGEGTGGAQPVAGGDVPLGLLVFVDRFVAFDHQEGKAYVLALARAPCADGGFDAADDRNNGGEGDTAASSDPREEALEWIGRTSEHLRSIASEAARDGAGPSERRETRPLGAMETATACAMDVPRSKYERSLEEIMRLVGEGETYEVCLTNQIVCERPGDGLTPPLDLYSRLRRSNPAPYSAYIVHDPDRRLSGHPESDRSAEGAGPAFAVCCSSPERFLKVNGHGWAESKPIKGTAKRGKTVAEDLALATDLAKGEKNTAENLMIVDLVRNDLGRVCRTGSVSVPKLMHVESYATVHQLVSTIRGRLSPGCGALDAIAAAFPGGSMTGAPKQRTMEIIDRLEHGRSRGVYSGSIGFLSLSGAADFNIVIRTAVVTPQNVTVGAGGAVIALSEIDDEYEEMLLKATSVLGAIGHKQRPGQLGPPGSEPLSVKASAANNAQGFDQGSGGEGLNGRQGPARNGGRRSVATPGAAVGIDEQRAVGALLSRAAGLAGQGGGDGTDPKAPTGGGL